ncbi:MAG: hypothetical protein KQI81_23125 [Deltaproteobacteria bacterium]|nr:hypothetical protein [Deltaproteobacteria bacterium]
MRVNEIEVRTLFPRWMRLEGMVHSVLMGKSEQPWQNLDYVYRLFSHRKMEARKKYRGCVESGLSEGKRPDLTGGGLLRSLGGWTGVKDFRKAGIRVKGDERILGDSDFVETVLGSTREALEERYFLKARGIDFDQVVLRVANVMQLTPDRVTAMREIAPDRPGPVVAMFLGASEPWNDHDRDRQAAQDKPTGGKSLLETGGTN